MWGDYVTASPGSHSLTRHTRGDLEKCLTLATSLFLSYLKDTVMMRLFPEANIKRAVYR